MRLIVGLGNPGAEYERNRHNIGFMVLDRVNKLYKWQKKYTGLLAESQDGDLFFKPHTMMNSSGDAVTALMGARAVETSELIVIHDDMDIPLGETRIKMSGGHGGHNGVRSIIDRLGNNTFMRIKCGIGRPAEGVEVLKHVLGNFGADEAQRLQEMIGQAASVALTELTKKDEKTSDEDKSSST
jgi:PTH1 family peptidyl-tRNA hydrolase